VKESFEVILKDYATQVLIERDTTNSEVNITWFDIKNGQKVFRRNGTEEKMTHDEFIKFKNMMKSYNQIIE